MRASRSIKFAARTSANRAVFELRGSYPSIGHGACISGNPGRPVTFSVSPQRQLPSGGYLHRTTISGCIPALIQAVPQAEQMQESDPRQGEMCCFVGEGQRGQGSLQTRPCRCLLSGLLRVTLSAGTWNKRSASVVEKKTRPDGCKNALSRASFAVLVMVRTVRGSGRAVMDDEMQMEGESLTLSLLYRIVRPDRRHLCWYTPNPSRKKQDSRRVFLSCCPITHHPGNRSTGANESHHAGMRDAHKVGI